MSFGPTKLNFGDITINSLGSLLAGIMGSIIIIIITFILGDSLNIAGTFAESKIGTKTSSVFPLVLSIITLIGTTISTVLSYILLNMTYGEKYRRNVVIFGQIAFFSVLTYIFITPMYIYTGVISYDNIMIVFIMHTLILAFGTSLILELLNNYRYVLPGLYGSFVGLFFSIIFSVLIFTSFSSGYAKLISLLLILPVINFSMTFFKQIFEMLYFHYYKYSAQDQLGDIFEQIENEEKEILREEEEKNSI